MSALKSRLLIAIILLFVSNFSFSQSYKQAFKFAKFLDLLEAYYVDSINSETIVDEAIVDVLGSLDPHSTYIPADELKKMREPLEGNFEGIGVEFNILKDTLYVIAPISGGPSERLGVHSGDKIILVDGKKITNIGLTNEDVFGLLRGKKGTEVTISILRQNVKGLIDFKIVRDKIPIYSIDASYMLNENTGYIKINRFSATTVDEFKEAESKLKSKKAQNLIIDLTSNGGGYLDAAVKLADEFLPENKMIVYTQGINNPRREYLSTSEGSFENGNIIVLIDEGSASASEILSGALQDWDRALVIGRRSFGKGLVQREFMLPDESALRITVANYYTPSGRLIQKPYNEGIEKYELEVYQRYNNGQLLSKDSIHFPDSLKFQTLIKHRTVYGGGGIMPDIFVPFDTSYYTVYYRDILRKGILNRFTLEYVDQNRIKLLKTYKEFKEFEKGFVVDEALFGRFTSFAEKEGVKYNAENIKISSVQISTMIKALVAKDLYGRDEFFQIYNTSNETYLKAIEVLKDWNKYSSELLQ